MTDYQKQAQRLAEEYAATFHGPTFSLDDGAANFSLSEASQLIRQAQIAKQETLRNIEAQRGAQQTLDQQREDISLLPDRESEKIQAEWRQEAARSAEAYVSARNRKAHPRSTIGVDPSITEGVISWVKRQKLRGSFGGRQTLSKN